MQSCIDLLMSYENGFALHSWKGRYGGDTWVCLMPTPELAEVIRDATDMGDCDMVPLTEYFRSTEWLPIIVAGDLKTSIAALEARLASLPREALGRDTRWATQVAQAVKHAHDVILSSGDYGGCDGKLDKLPMQFAN